MISPIEVAPASGPNMIKLCRVSQTARKQLVFKLTDDSGAAVDLLSEVENPPAAAADFSPQPAANGANVTIKLRTRSGDLSGPCALDITGNILDQTEHRGFVEFILETTDTSRPGIFEASIERYTSNMYLVDTWPLLLTVEPPAMNLLDACPTGPLLIPEIRLALLDLDNQAGYDTPFRNLLDDAEFQDIEIVVAQARVVQLWNETPPRIQFYTPQNFPYRYWWLQGTVGELLISGAARYRRNQLDYSAGGVSINDQNKADQYEQIGRLSQERFVKWMRDEKVSINMGRAWGIGL